MNLFSIGFIFFFISETSAIYQWSFQQRLIVPEAGQTYGVTPSGHLGRGFETLITGYDASTASPGIYIHTSDMGDVNLTTRHVIWSQQAKLQAKDAASQSFTADGFGQMMVTTDQTLIVSAPKAGSGRGYVYIFNGTLRHWTQIQKLSALDGGVTDNFGTLLSLHGDRVLISSPGALTYQGAAYVYARVSNTLYWSRQGKLLAADGAASLFFAAHISLHNNIAIATANNDAYTIDYGNNNVFRSQTGSVYIFQYSGTQWSQAQKLIALDMQHYKNRQNIDTTDQTYGDRHFGSSVGVNDDYISVGCTNEWHNKTNRGTVYVFRPFTTDLSKWSLQQRLFYHNDTVNITTYQAEVYMDHIDTLIATTTGPDITISYIFKTSASGWSQQQAISPCDPALVMTGVTNQVPAYDGLSCVNWSNPQIVGGNLYHTSITKAGTPELQIRTEYRNTSCLLIWLSDHFLDGWDTAVLTVRAPDTTNDTFHPHCDQVDPFYIRYCPRMPEDDGVYIIKVFAATRARFFWEISWRVQIENTDKWYLGDFSTTMHFNFDRNSSTFDLVYSENLVDLEGDCFRCTTIANRDWAQLQITGNSAFWPLDVVGAPYYISDYAATNVVSSGKVCDGITFYECYQTLTDGVYILRLGGGLFGRLTGFPHSDGKWSGCGRNGTYLDQFVFAIAKGVCTPVQVFRYTTRCAQPPPVNQDYYSSTATPTKGGTVAPTQSTFGNPYRAGLYSIDIEGVNLNNDDYVEPVITDTMTTMRRLREEEEQKRQRDAAMPKEAPQKLYSADKGKRKRRI